MRFFKRLDFGQRMLLCCASLMGVLVMVGISWRASVVDLGSSLREAVNRTAVKLRMAGDLRTEFRGMRAEARATQFSVVIRLLNSKDAKGKEDAVSAGCVVCHNQEMQDEGRNQFVKGGGRVRQQLGELRGLAPSPEEERLVDAIGRDVEEWVSLYAQYLQLASSDRYDAAHSLMTEKIAPLLEHADQSVASLMELQRAALARAAAGAEDGIAKNSRRALLLISIGFGLGIFVFLTIRWMTASLRQVATEVEAGAASVTNSARQSSSASAALAQGAVEQMSSLSEAVEAGAKIGQVSGGNEKRARAAAEDAARGKRESNDARRLLDSTRAAMTEAEAASTQMGAILRVIDEIAFQTNILALNAAVEAARAGEAGLSFAVVANEVRTLARRCAEASQQITGLVANASVKNRDTWESLSQFDTVLRQLAEGSAGLETLLAGVAADSRRQHQDLDQMSGSLQQMDKVTQANAGVAEESAAAAAHLEHQAAALSEAAEHLTLLVGGARSRS